MSRQDQFANPWSPLVVGRHMAVVRFFVFWRVVALCRVHVIGLGDDSDFGFRSFANLCSACIEQTEFSKSS